MRPNQKLMLGLFRAGYVTLFVLLITPLLIVIITSFTEARYLTFPPESFTLQWYGEFIEDTSWIGAVFNSHRRRDNGDINRPRCRSCARR